MSLGNVYTALSTAVMVDDLFLGKSNLFTNLQIIIFHQPQPHRNFLMLFSRHYW